ncbi:DNA-binding protein [Eubacteriales bacterium OttesenSCG-928-N13]|nr:DNA-binding protein [Eubacteriales bacterium OttesenSCG-928-N13]
MERRNDMNLLLDFYGGLLNDSSMKMCSMYYGEDMTLAEIAELMGVTRQAVHGVVRRTEDKLLNYESKLHLIDKSRKIRREINAVTQSLERVEASTETKQALAQAIESLGRIEWIEE